MRSFIFVMRMKPIFDSIRLLTLPLIVFVNLDASTVAQEVSIPDPGLHAAIARRCKNLAQHWPTWYLIYSCFNEFDFLESVRHIDEQSW